MPTKIVIELIGGSQDGRREEIDWLGELPKAIVQPRLRGTRRGQVCYNFSHESNGVHYYVLEKKPAKA